MEATFYRRLVRVVEKIIMKTARLRLVQTGQTKKVDLREMQAYAYFN